MQGELCKYGGTMREEEERILKMVEEGAISADEAGELLSAMEKAEEVAPAQAPEVPDRDGTRARFDRAWEVPFFGGFVVAGFGLLGLIRTRGRDGVFVRTGASLTFVLGLLGIFVGHWSRDAAWLHIRVQERDGDNVNLSFPLPLGLADWVMNLARGYVDEETAGHLDNAQAFIDALRRGEKGEPFTVEVEEGDGDRVFIQIG
jgi:hypothetical protein